MPVYEFKSLLASLSIRDTPVSYTPPVGAAIDVRLTYNQREADQPTTFDAFNLGQKWTLNWLSYIQDDPASAGSNVTRYVADGGGETYSGYSASTGAFAPEADNGAVLVLTSSNPITYELRRADGSKAVFAESDGQATYPRKVFLTQEVDAHGNAVTLNYDSQLRLTSVTDAIGQSTTFQYGNSNPLLVTGITDPFGRHAALGYDSAGRLDSITDEIGMTSTFTYDGTGTFVQSMTTPYGTTHFAQTQGANGDATELSIEATDPLGYTERTEYHVNAPGVPYSVTDTPSGMSVDNGWLDYRNTFYWNKDEYAAACTGSGATESCDYTKARLKHFLHESPCCEYTARYLESIKYPLEARIWYDYPGQSSPSYPGTLARPSHTGRVLSDGTTQLTAYTYNSIGNVTSKTDPDGRQTVYTYAPNGIDVTEVQQKNGAGFDTVAQYTYDSQHDPLTYTDAAGQTTTYTWNARGQRTSVTDPLGNTTTYTYDGNGYLTAITNALGHVQHSFTYDADGRVASDTDSQGYVRHYQYDALDRVTSITYPDGTARQFVWNKLDLASVTDREGRTTTYTYDADRNRVAMTDPMGQVTRMGYTPSGQLRTLTDPNGHLTTWTHDIEGRVIARTHDDGKGDTYTYDDSSRLVSKTDALGQATHYVYDADDLLTDVSYTGAVTPTAAVAYQYDAAYPRLAGMSDGLGVTTFDYVPVGTPGALQVQSVVGPFGADGSVGYAYDADGRVIHRTTDAVASYGRDALGRVVTVSNALGSFHDSYLGDTDQVTQEQGASLIAGAGYVLNLAYDGNTGDRQLQSLTWNGPGSLTQMSGGGSGGAPLIERMQFTHSAEHEVLSKVRGFGASVPPGTALAVSSQHYSYDADGRLVQAAAGQAPNYQYDAAGNLIYTKEGTTTFNATANDLNQLSIVNGTAWQYDADGNLINDGHYQYAWDAANRLASITDTSTGTVTRFAYDGLGRRLVIGQTNTSGTHTEIRYLWCGDTVCGARDDSGQILADYYPQGEQHDSYTQAGQREEANSYYLRDQIGSIIGSVNDEGILLGSTAYTSYGMVRGEAGQQADFGYAGMLKSPVAGLYLTKYRAYSPSAGRWLSRDPIGIEGGENIYAYVGGDPVMSIDPYGMDFMDPVWGAIYSATGGWSPSQGTVDFWAGMGDTLSFGLTNLARDAMGTNDVVNKCSGSYWGGEVAGAALDIGIGGAAGLEAAGERGAGKEFSHWIPNRMGGPRSPWNGNYVSTETHALSDPFRYRFMPRPWKAGNPMPNAAWQQWTRLPNVYKGMGVGAAAGAAGMVSTSNCGCQQ